MTGNPPRVVGLDLSMTATGVARCDGETYTYGPPAEGDRRLLQIVEEIAVATRDADLVVIEDLPPTRGQALGVLGMVHGAVRAHLIRVITPYALITPSGLKKYATGNGGANKTAMALAALKRHGVELTDDNRCDAWWLRAAGLDHLGHPIAPMPATHRAALDKVAWPDVSPESLAGGAASGRRPPRRGAPS